MNINSTGLTRKIIQILNIVKKIPIIHFRVLSDIAPGDVSTARPLFATAPLMTHYYYYCVARLISHT